MKSLFDQTQLGSLKLKNRFIRSATYEGMADEKGHMTDDLFKVYENLRDFLVHAVIFSLSNYKENSYLISKCSIIFVIM